MNFYKTIKEDLLNEEKRRGRRNKVIVDSKALRMLLDDYEKIDSFARAQVDNMHVGLLHKLHNVLQALYHENHDSERLMLDIMLTLKPMIEERMKLINLERIYSGG